MTKEFEFLNIINNSINNKYLGDDCAYLKEYELVVSSDSLIEDVHFSCSYMSPYEIAKKALLVNISDVLAAGSIPQFVTINLSGKLNNDFVAEFYKGVKEITDKYSITVIGGDLTDGDKLTIAITIMGKTSNCKISSRKNAKEGYIVAVAGEFGSSAKGLEELRQGKTDSYFIKYHKEPPLYFEVSQYISQNVKKPYAMMDSSDGLFDALYQISQKSNVRINVDYSLIPKKVDNKDFVLYGGEDYSLVICLNEADYKNIHGIIKIGECIKGSGVFVDKQELMYGGFKHFE